MKKHTKQLALFTLFILFAFGQTTHVAAWSFLPNFSFSKSSLSSFATKKILIPLGALATAVAAYTAYKYWPWKKPTDSTGAYSSSNPSTSPTTNDSRVLSLVPLKKDLEPQTITASRELHPVNSREEMWPGALADARTAAPDFADSDSNDETPTTAAAAAAVDTQTTDSSNSSAASSDTSSPSPRSTASTTPPPVPAATKTIISAPNDGDVLVSLLASLRSNEYQDDDQPHEEINTTAIGLLKSYLDHLKDSFTIQNLSLKPIYLELYNKEFFKGFRNNYTIDNLAKSNNQQEFRDKLIQNYKIHLMPKDDDMAGVLSKLLNKVKCEEGLKKHISGIKIIYDLEKAKSLDQEMPRIVIYPASSKESAQKVLDAMCKIFKGHAGLDITPRFNQRVTSLIYYAQGDGQHKNKQYQSYFEKPNRIHYATGFTFNGNYKLTFEEPARPSAEPNDHLSSAPKAETLASRRLLESSAAPVVSTPKTWAISNNGHTDQQQITITHQAETQRAATTIVTFFVYPEGTNFDDDAYASIRTLIEKYQQTAYPQDGTAQLKFYGLHIPNSLKTDTDKLKKFIQPFSAETSKVITVAFGESAELINAISNEVSIDTMIHLNPTFNGNCKPSNFRRLYNLYSREGMQYVRKYEQQPRSTFDMPIKNIRVVTTAKNGSNFLDKIADWSSVLPEWANLLPATQTSLQQWVGELPSTIVDYKAENFLHKNFIDQLSAIIDTVEQEYTLNFDIVVKIDETPTPPNYEAVPITAASESWTFLQETTPSYFRRPVVVVNRFVEFQDDKLIMHDGMKNYSLQTPSSDLLQVQKQYTKEYQTSKSALFDLITNVVEQPLSWNTHNEFIQRHNNVETSRLYDRSDLQLNPAFTGKLSELQNKLKLPGIEALPFSIDFAKERIVNGATIAHNLETTNFKTLDQKQYLDNILSFSWLLYSLALQKNQLFTEGTFVIKDPGFKIFNFLFGYIEKCGSTNEKGEISYNPFGYNRVSSHFKAELKENPSNIHYGIDIRYTERSSALTTLPTGKRHILFAKLNNTDLIFVKFENYGIYAYDGFPQHGVEFIESVARKLGLTHTSDDADDYRKERVPSAFIKEFNRVVDESGFADKKALKKQAKDKGIQVLYQNDTIKTCRDFDALRNTVATSYDNPEMRWGREVIVLPGEMTALSSEITRLNTK